MAPELLAHLELQTQGRLGPAAGGGPGPCGSVPAGLPALTTCPRALGHPLAKLRLDVTARVSQPCLSGARLPAPTSGTGSARRSGGLEGQAVVSGCSSREALCLLPTQDQPEGPRAASRTPRAGAVLPDAMPSQLVPGAPALQGPLPAHPQASRLQSGASRWAGPVTWSWEPWAPKSFWEPPPASRCPHRPGPGRAHRVWTWTVSWYSRSNMHIFRSTMDLGTQTGTSTATPMARKCN